MNKKRKEAAKAILLVIFIGILFILSSVIVNYYIEDLKLYASHNFYLGIFVYIFISAISIIVAPVSSLPLLPFASAIWGWKLAAVFSVIGWSLGEIVTFYLARKYGKPLVQKLISLKEVDRFEKFIPHEHLFISILIMRIVLPTDGLGYALGLFSNVKMKPYAIATILGTIPFAFTFAYLGTLNVIYQIVGFAVAFILVVILLGLSYYYNKKLNKK